jgi:hypothetical protein
MLHSVELMGQHPLYMLGHVIGGVPTPQTVGMSRGVVYVEENVRDLYSEFRNIFRVFFFCV